MRHNPADITNTVVSILAQLQLDELNGKKVEDLVANDIQCGEVLKNIINLPGLDNNQGRALAMIFYHLHDMGKFSDIEQVYNQLPQRGLSLDAHTRRIIDAITTHKTQADDYTYRNEELEVEIKSLIHNPTTLKRNIAKLLNSYDHTSLNESKHIWIVSPKSSAGERFGCALYNQRCGSKYMAKRMFTQLAALPRIQANELIPEQNDLVKD